MNAVRKIAVLLIGFVFFIAGFLKLVDPVGTSLIVGDYFSFFHLAFLRFAALPAAVLLALFETALGAALLTGVWPRVVSFVTAGTLAVFTVLTFILWIADPPMDCGCFGQAIHLTHAQTLLKNLALDVLWCTAFLPLSCIRKPQKIKYVSFGIAALSVLAFCVYTLVSLPLVDHTPFHNGVELGEGEEHLTAQLSLTDPEGNYLDSVVTKGNVLLLSVYNPGPSSLEKADAYRQELAGAGVDVLVLASGDPEEIIAARPSLAGGLYLADRRTLMTLNRSNGGITYLYNGQIVKKWSVNFRPSAEKIGQLFDKTPIESLIKENSADRKWLQGFLLYVFAVMLLL